MHPDKEFTGFDCTSVISIWWQKLFRKIAPWKQECIKHHIHYWVGGSYRDRLCADALLLKGVIHTGHPFIGLLVFITARLFGSSNWGSGYEHHRNTYFDRQHELFVIMEEKFTELGIATIEIFGGRKT